MSTQISDTTVRTREGARRRNGEFGPQPHTESGLIQAGVEMSESTRTVREDGTEVWMAGDELHRTDGPAVTRPDGTQEFWLNDRLLNGASLAPGYLPDDEPPF